MRITTVRRTGRQPDDRNMAAIPPFHPKMSQFERILPDRLLKQRQATADKARRNDIFIRWRESERILNLLRSIKPTEDELTPEMWHFVVLHGWKEPV